MSIQSLKTGINLPNKITIKHIEHDTSALDVKILQQYLTTII